MGVVYWLAYDGEIVCMIRGRYIRSLEWLMMGGGALKPPLMIHVSGRRMLTWFWGSWYCSVYHLKSCSNL